MKIYEKYLIKESWRSTKYSDDYDSDHDDLSMAIEKRTNLIKNSKYTYWSEEDGGDKYGFVIRSKDDKFDMDKLKKIGKAVQKETKHKFLPKITTYKRKYKTLWFEK